MTATVSRPALVIAVDGEPAATELTRVRAADLRAAQARASYASLGAATDGVTYVGTPSGLKSLIDDVYAAEVADAVVLRPVGGARTQQLIASLLAA
ncbi:hypothetical protein TSST111916_19235 [Tsukamurella strandjordii]|uniref:hypothetical protein n=1 Tax=Tsukamurella strandjordii TaxID=147577 RepID=UPI0039F0DBC4